MSSQSKKPSSRGKNVALAVATLAVILLVLVILQLVPHPSPSQVKGTSLSGVKVGSTTDWQGLAWGDTRKITIDSRGTIYVAYRTTTPESIGEKAFVDFSTDNGLTWSHLGGQPIDTLVPGTQVQRVPAISIGSNDVLQAVWNEVPNEASGDRQIWYSRWFGTHWSTPQNIPFYIQGYGQSIPDPSHWQEHPDILVDQLNSSRVYVTWEGTDPANFSNVNCGSTNCNTPMFTVSEDGGTHWSTYLKLSQPNGDDQSRPTITEDSTGRLYVAWYTTNATIEGNAQIRWVSSPDHGKSWSQPQLILETYGVDQRDPSLAADSKGRVYMVWKEKNMHSSQNQTMYSLLFSGSWTNPIRVSPDNQNQLYPIVQVDNASNVYVGWHTDGPYMGGDPSGRFPGAQIWISRFNYSNSSWSTRQLTSSTTNRFINFPSNPIRSSSIQISWIEGDSRPYYIEFATLKF